jgi:DNA-binding FadR family transcriptional regulator
MGMERLGLVAQLEAELERIISLGLLPQGGKLASERTLASKYGVSRATAREALVRLRTRGLVEVRPGRRARAVVMEQAVRLENLGTALLGEGPSRPERHALLAGYLELKRDVTVELLAACCEKASEEELERVRNACFLLGDAACWELKRPSWVALEFELLRQAALAAQRPGHLLLIQTLERACRGMAGRVEPYLDSPALYRWTQCAMEALCSKDVKEVRCRLPALLQASDERVLQALAPSCEAYGIASFMSAERQVAEVKAEVHPAVAQGREVSKPVEALLTTSQAPVASHEAPGAASFMGAQRQAPEVEAEVHPTAAQDREVSEPVEGFLTDAQAPVHSELAEASLHSAQAPEVKQPAPEPMSARGPGALCAMWSGFQTSLCQVPPEGAPPAPASVAPHPIPTTGRLWPRSTEGDSWP